MPVVNPQKLIDLQKNAQDVRNICILAHVDHGKTSLTDSLIATNGIISSRMAGKIRYLDSRPDEQIRGITMESSAISLFFSLLRKSNPDAPPHQKDYLINLIDSPGHIDFSSEVSTASRLCDGAVVLVDAVEGVCSQTVAVLRQTWIEHLKPILVINKMDRLVTELRMTPVEAYSHLSKLIEQVNAVIGSFFQGERMEDDLKWRERLENRLNGESTIEKTSRGAATDAEVEAMLSVDDSNGDNLASYEEKEDEDIYFEPEKGNVIFSSAVDGWAFTIKQFAGFYEKKLGIKRSLLEKVLWGDYYLDPKTKRILGSKHLKGRSLKPMFVQLVLENIWAVYEATVGGNKGKGDATMVEKITKSLSISLPAHILRSRDPHAILTALFSAWIPLSTALLVSVVEHLPSPITAQTERMPGLLDLSPGSKSIDINVRESMIQMRKQSSDPVVAFISKMVAIPEKDLPENKSRTGATLTAEEARELGRKKRAEIARAQAIANGEEPDVAELRESISSSAIGANPKDTGKDDKEEEEEVASAEPERLIGFARLFSGTLHVGDEVYVLGPKFSPDSPLSRPEPQKATVTALYMMMGRGLEPLTSVPAGVVFGVAGLEGIVVKSGTLCSQLEGGVNLAGLSMGSQPIVRVAVEPENPANLGKMVTGLRLLSQSDPSASYEIMESGEHVLLTAGELHLERCLKDLRERFARCEIQAGAPIVPYRESIISATEMNPQRDKDLPRGTVFETVSSRLISIRLRVVPLPERITEFLIANAPLIRDCFAEQQLEDVDGEDSDGDSNNTAKLTDAKTLDSLKRLKDGLKAAAEHTRAEAESWKDIADKVVAFGPRRNGPNILVDATRSQTCQKIWLGTLIDQGGIADTNGGPRSQEAITAQDFSDKILYAFQLASAHGPLCQEPMQGVAVFLEEMQMHESTQMEGSSRDQFGRLTGEVIKTVRQAIGKGFLDWSPRMMLAMYSCEIQASTEVLGRVYGVITRRRGRILSESMNEGTPFFTIVSVLPVAESFGFSDEIRKRTSGAASPQLVFQGFEMLDEDPFWMPFTEEELEDLGELADKENVAKRYMDAVRKRKGLFVREKKVEAEKQKTLKR